MSLASLETRTIVYHWFSLGTSGSQRLPMVLSGYLWFSMVLSGYQWFSVVTSDSQRLPVVLNGISGYQWKLTYPICMYQVPKCIEPLMGSYSMYLHVPKNLFPKWHSVGNTVRSQRSKTFQQSYIDTCSTAKTTKQLSLLLLAVQRQLPTVKVTHFPTSSNVNHFNHTYHI